MKLPPASMKTSGTQRPVGHAASCDAIVAGTSAVARQWAPPAGSHEGRVLGSSTGAPTCGHAATCGGPASPCAGEVTAPASRLGVQVPPFGIIAPPLFPISHAPEDIIVSGLMHGAHRSSAAHVACGSSDSYCATCGTHTLRQTPSALLRDLQLGGAAVGSLMKVSGTQKPPVHAASWELKLAGTSVLGTQ